MQSEDRPAEAGSPTRGTRPYLEDAVLQVQDVDVVVPRAHDQTVVLSQPERAQVT